MPLMGAARLLDPLAPEFDHGEETGDVVDSFARSMALFGDVP
jgi:hypothetical protein